MSNMESYLDWRGDIGLEASAFNEVDSLILCQLSYCDFDGIIPAAGEGKPVPIREAARAYAEKVEKAQELPDAEFAHSLVHLIEHAAACERFRKVQVFGYKAILDPVQSAQMAAVSYLLPDGTVYAAYRGTDQSIAGWKEDFKLSFLPETEGQRYACRYLLQIAELEKGRLRTGGHSKGGNFAVYAALKAEEAVQARIEAVYNHDGPGFVYAIQKSEAYSRLRERIHTTVPRDTIIGALLFHEAEPKVVMSTAQGLAQHELLSWEVLGTDFVLAPGRSDLSLFVENVLNKWLSELDSERRESFVNELFAFFEATGAASFAEMKKDIPGAAASVLNVMRRMQKGQRQEFWDVLGRLAVSGGEGLARAVQNSLEWLRTQTAGEMEQLLEGKDPSETDSAAAGGETKSEKKQDRL